ncbi:unnamed protein product [Ostreobium quekettii]|uniref:Uncharacterized protein n=1 Tax=Ostreobium quekettii TaxID=121088 RepID=A0A8S1IU82_9CHLO|nr:unnamed protein product [Ostreobium quekettii]|eukprot:evm.model.scf_1.1 EVM.evm.TU.scf_1.1   scf_1:23540-24328(+)
MAPISRRVAACVAVLAMVGMEAGVALGGSRIGGIGAMGVSAGRRLLQDRLMPWAMRVATCAQLREALQWEGLPRVIVMAPIACAADEWPEAVVVSWDVEIMGASAWEMNRLGDAALNASIDWSAVGTAVVVTGGAELKVHSLILRQKELSVEIPEFRLAQGSGVYSGLAVSAASCSGRAEGYVDAVYGWVRPVVFGGRQRARAVGAGALLVEDGAKYGGNLDRSTTRLCASAFSCPDSDLDIQELFESDYVDSECPATDGGN